MSLWYPRISGRERHAHHRPMVDSERHCLTSLMLVCALALSLTNCGTTDSHGQRDTSSQQLFDIADRDRDSLISLDEWDAWIEQLFMALDTTGDLHLDPQELRSSFDIFDQNNNGIIDVREAPVLVIQADKDGDNFVVFEEFQAFDWSVFKADVNIDGLVSPEEFRQPRRRLFYDSDLDRDAYLKRSEFDESARIILFQW